jgi:hypothetical protein
MPHGTIVEAIGGIVSVLFGIAKDRGLSEDEFAVLLGKALYYEGRGNGYAEGLEEGELN